jgi:hypothetical protein
MDEDYDIIDDLLDGGEDDGMPEVYDDDGVWIAGFSNEIDPDETA